VQRRSSTHAAQSLVYITAALFHVTRLGLTSHSEFPSLSNNQHQASTSAQSTWAMSGMRSLGQATSQRPQQSMLPLQQSQAQQQTQQQQDDLFSSSSQLSNTPASFRFGSEITVGQSSQSQPNSEEFPPLNRNINGDIGQDRTLGQLPSVGFGAQTRGSTFGGGLGASQNVRNNGLLNALSGSNRGPLNHSQVASPGSVGGELYSFPMVGIV
jgi:CCR4-NOT transcription complex subunit 2